MDPDAPALNTDGTLKDASEIQWFNLLSDECCTINLKDSDVQKKHKHADSSAHGSDTDSKDGLPRSVLTGLKGKSPTRQVGGKRTQLLSNKAKAATSQLMAKEHGFYEKRFTVSLGKDNDSMTAMSSSMTVKAKPTQPKPKKTQPKPPPTTRRANSAPPSPKKCPPAPDPTTPPNKPTQASTSKARCNVITDTDDDMTEDNMEVDEGNEDGEGNESSNEQDMDEDPLQKYL
ncbi:hypothetical protein CPB84DRAFT_1849809 [Gymnopilus junonius]|uniref:Uncharacterized protein n=1 Tax=Gymnopilus junonius TaxID=109634 RepID=A0A9P5NFG3_GYMJU|nr:hypothetical protein CPB84DRAFT_1849809 [Gymnopilus junonius]